MLILTLKTDKPLAEIGLYDDNRRLNYAAWQAHRELAETIQDKIESVLQAQGKGLKDVQGLAVFKGPGSFTGLRIGLSVANALAYALSVPIVACGGENWLEAGLKALTSGANQHIALPDYGADVHITTPKK